MSFFQLFSLNGRTKNFVFVRIYVLTGILAFALFIAAHYLPFIFMKDAVVSIASALSLYVILAGAVRRLHDMNMRGLNVLWLSIPFVISQILDLHGFLKFAIFASQMLVFVFLGIGKPKEPNRF